MSEPIESYGMIGDCQTAALIGKNGSIDWLCWPRFDSDACFAALLGGPEHGYWRISPGQPITSTRRRYRPDTLILETEFETETGRMVLTDFMLPGDSTSDLIRIATCEQGEVIVEMDLVIRFGYGATTPWVTRPEDGMLHAVAGPDMIVLHTSAPFENKDFKTQARFVLSRGQAMPFVLNYGPSHLQAPPPVDAHYALRHCEKFWRDWTARTKADGPHSEAIKRSLITLKGLTYLPTGGIVAAPTTSLPEQFGSERNWDYRLCWLRDTTLTLLAMMNAGIYDEAAAWREWLQRAVAGSPDEMQIMYGLSGERRLTEWEIEWLPGYANSRPVRVGNAAHEQFQLDVYGELMDAAEQSRKGGLAPNGEGWALQRALIEHVVQIWDKPDSGIWETRGPPQHFVYSKVMAWVVFDRAVKSVENFGLDGSLEEWRAIRDRIHAEVCDKGFDKARKTFRAAYESNLLDASLLLMAQTGFIKAHDPRFIGTVEAIERDLLRDGFVLRYNTHDENDGLTPGEGAFLACSFWLADAYISVGREADAAKLFDRLLSIRNDLGLLAEEYEPHEKRLQGNFPQAFSHIALINTAFNLTRNHKPSEQRSGAHPSAHHGLKGKAKPNAKKVSAPPRLSRRETSSESR